MFFGSKRMHAFICENFDKEVNFQILSGLLKDKIEARLAGIDLIQHVSLRLKANFAK